MNGLRTKLRSWSARILSQTGLVPDCLQMRLEEAPIATEDNIITNFHMEGTAKLYELS